jgi:metal-responsive CopG/Arc/MetJ family transcriptional regulator
VCYVAAVSRTLTIRLDEATARALDKAAERMNRSRGEILRQALAEHLEKASSLDALGDIVGCMSGPPDLSTNKKYLKRLGRKKGR